MASTGRTKGGLRRLVGPFVVPMPTGVSTRDRLRVTEAEEVALAEVGVVLGGLYRADYRARALEGRLGPAAKAVSRRERKRGLTAVSSSRWAGAITRKTEDQYNLGMRGLLAERTMLTQATDMLQKRLAVEPGEVLIPARGKPTRGYKTKAEWFQKSRRLASLGHRLNVAESRIESAYPHVVHGGGRLWSNKQNLVATSSAETKWRKQWNASRMFLTADGETGKRFGNETIRVDPDGFVSIKIPVGLPHLITEHGTHLRLTTPLNLATHRATEWLERVNHNRSVGYTITFDAPSGRWYMNAAWSLHRESFNPDNVVTFGKIGGDIMQVILAEVRHPVMHTSDVGLGASPPRRRFPPSLGVRVVGTVLACCLALQRAHLGVR